MRTHSSKISLVIDGSILCVMMVAAGGALLSQSSPEEKVGKTVSWQKDLPAGAKVHEMTPQEMKKYDDEASAKIEIKPGPIIRAPKSGIETIDPAILGILRQQKLAVSQMKLHSALAATQAPVAQPAQKTNPMSQSLQASPPIAVAGAGPQAATGSLPTTASTTLNRPMLLPAQTGSSPSTLMSASGSSAGSPTTMSGASPVTRATPTKTNLGAMPPPSIPTVTYVCQTPLISDVNHQIKNAVFTPEVEYNSYVIKGCFFGKQQGKIYLAGKFNAQQVNLVPDFWSDTEIDARVDPKTSGEQDQQNVTLIVSPVGAGQIKATGFEFVAARSNPAVFLSTIPKSWFTYSGWSGSFVNPTANIQSPPGAYAPSSLQGYSVYVSRSYDKKFSPGSDMISSSLAPGWTLDSVQMTQVGFPPSCPGVVTYKQTFGIAEAYMIGATPDWTKIQGHGIRVDGSDTSCSGFIPIAPPFVYWTYSDYTGSAYALKIWAKGPRCTDPYSGQPAQQCMQNMQQCGTETCSN